MFWACCTSCGGYGELKPLYERDLKQRVIPDMRQDFPGESGIFQDCEEKNNVGLAWQFTRLEYHRELVGITMACLRRKDYTTNAKPIEVGGLETKSRERTAKDISY